MPATDPERSLDDASAGGEGGDDSAPRTDGRSMFGRRTVLGAGVGLLGSLAGCPGSFGGDRPETTSGGPETVETPAASVTASSVRTTGRVPALSVAPGAALTRPIRHAAELWNGNPGPDGYRQLAGERPETDARLADRFATERGLDPTGERGRPPVHVALARLEPDERVSAVADGSLDVFTLGPSGFTDASVVAETLPDEEAGRLVSRPLAYGGQAFFVSPALAEAGVTALTPDQVRGLYDGRIANWRTVGGPDRPVYAVAGPSSTPNGRMKETFLRRQGGVDVRFGQSRNRRDVVSERDDAVGYLPVGYAESSLPALRVVVDGEPRGVTDPEYPTTATHEAYAWEQFDRREGAFVDMLRSSVGQAVVGDRRGVLPYDRSP